ncbi:hypothetical protein LEP1GSC099_2525 [Leptospira interrogans str. UI 08452]|nr:hypothetical protein LEP1GSC099_2525 [Leptospira interrogans str. UI 08452]
MNYHNRIVEKLILHLFLFYGNGQLKQFCESELGNFSTTLIYKIEVYNN